MPGRLVAFALVMACATESMPPNPLFKDDKATSCSEDLAMAAFSEGDISQARAVLAVYKGSSKLLRECAISVWRQGVENVALMQEHGDMKATLGSKVLERFGKTSCAASAGDGSWLDIPRVQELVVCVRTGEQTLIFEQDGFLRAFDMPTVLWPAGFFLTLWVTDHCRLLKGHASVLNEPKAASLSSAPGLGPLRLPRAYAVATGCWPRTRTNARINGANVEARLLDWDDRAAIDAFAANETFDVVLGAGLAPHRWGDPVWALLAGLLRLRNGRAVLCQGAGDLDLGSGTVGNGRFLVEKVVAGDAYGLQTRWGTPSEFELLVLRHVGSGDL